MDSPLSPGHASQGKDVEAAVSDKYDKQTLTNQSESMKEDENTVDFETDDPDNPLNWALWYKWVIVALVSTMTMIDSVATITIIPAVPQALNEFHVRDDLYSTFLVSIWELGEGIGPFLVAPLSERYGRLPVYHTGNVLFLSCSIASALSTNISMLVAFRFLNGLVITSLTLGPTIIADVFKKEERGLAMALAIIFQLVGPVAAPIIGSFIAQAKGWRWTIWIITISVGALTSLSILFFRETYQVKILQRRTLHLQKITTNNRLRSKHHSMTSKDSFIKSIKRPLKLLFFSPVVFIVSWVTALTYGLSYLIITTLTETMEKSYGFGQGIVGLSFLGLALGNLAGIVLYGATSDRYIQHKQALEGVLKPEHRLPPMLLGAIILPMGLVLYGWTAAEHLQWVAPLAGTSLIGFSMILTILPTENYLVDVYDLYGASAVAAGVITRASAGALLPLAGPPLYARLGIGWGNSLLGFLALVFIPAVVFLMIYGERMRTKSPFVLDL